MARTLDQLIDRDNPAWPLILSWTQAPGANSSMLLPPDLATRDETLLRLQVTTRSPLGAIAYESGGIAIQDGWLRLLGSGRPGEARSITDWNAQAGASDGGFLLVADDVLGGFFALNGGRFGGDTLGKVHYLAPDALDWQNLDFGHTDFVHWSLTGDLRAFYADFEGLGCWERAPRPSFDQAYAFYPFLWTVEGREHRAIDSRAVPIAEIWGMKAG